LGAVIWNSTRQPGHRAREYARSWIHKRDSVGGFGERFF